MTIPLDTGVATPRTSGVAPLHDAPQHRPRPLPLFLAMLRSETASDPDRAAAALAGLAAYQAALRPPAPPAPAVVAQAGTARLLDYGGGGRPVVFVPSLINGSRILDLLPELSFLRTLATLGLRPLLVDWGTPDAGDRGLGIGGHVEERLLPLLAVVGPDAALTGYCLGGTMALAAATIAPPHALALIAAPWRFSGFGTEARSAMADLWIEVAPTVEAMGLLPIEVLQAGFWRLDPTRTIAKFTAFGAHRRPLEATRRFVAIEDWANGGPPLTCATGRDLFEALFGADVTGNGAWRVGERIVDPARLACPVLDIVSSTDRIVPGASAAEIGTKLGLDLGHVGMIVGGRGRTALWEPLARWLRDPR